MDISFVIPCYCSAKTIHSVITEISETMNGRQEKYEYEIILVNDNSKDNTWDVINSLARENDKITAIDFSKNFGQPSALLAGFSVAKGNYIMTSDDDGQTPVKLFWDFVDKMKEGNDVVCVKYTQRHRKSLFRSFGTSLNNFMSYYILDKPKDVFLSSFFLAKRFVIDEIVKYDNPYPYIAGLLLRTTSKIGYIEVEQRERLSGNSGYNFKKLLSLWLNGFTAFSVKPLRVSIVIGFLSVACSLFFLIFLLIKKLLVPSTQMGYSSIMITILFFSGVILCVLGMIGEYIGRIYMCINNEPQFVIREKVHYERNKKDAE